MNYEDFPILSNNDYELLKQEFSIPKQNREKALIKVLSLLLSFCTCNITSKKLNTKILNTINQTKQVCIKIENNFSSLFNLTYSHHEIENLNLFSMIKKLLLASKELNILAENEAKIYYKKTFINSSKELIVSALDILSTLQDSYIITFNHM